MLCCVEDYEDFVKRCNLADEQSSMCKKADLMHIFDTTNEEEATLEAGRTRLEAVIASLHLKAHRPTGDIGPFYKPFGLQPNLRDTVPVWLLGESPTPLTLSRLVSASCPQPT